MGYERYPRNTDPQADYYGRTTPQDYGSDYGSGREFSYSSGRDYQAAGEIGDDRDRGDGRRERYGARGQYAGNRGAYAEGRRDRPYDGSDASDGQRFANPRRRDPGYGRQPQGYDYEERGFFDRAGDEVRSWFGDDDAERRREMDQRYDERYAGRSFGGDRRDEDYHGWRKQQIDALDRDYHEYRQENRQKFHNEFGSWRQERQGQRTSLSRVAEHMDVIGSDGEHVGTVDKVRGDRILLTKSDPEAGGHHRSIPSRWIDRVDDKVTIRKTASDAHAHWKDEERNQALFGDDRNDAADTHNLGRSFSGTY
ncbi:DUF2171 domain-containing protein [Sphingomonas koreensis]|nr:DUF2171 domain-containing protein [Sphingomonas koreensis]